MSIVASYTRQQWAEIGEWAGVEPSTDGVCLLFREEDDPADDILPVVVRIDPATRQPWPEDAAPLPDVPFRFYERDSDNGTNLWEFVEEGADQSAHVRIWFHPKQ